MTDRSDHAEQFGPAIEGIKKLTSDAVSQTKQAAGLLTAMSGEPEPKPADLVETARVLSEAAWRSRLLSAGLEEARRRVRMVAEKAAADASDGEEFEAARAAVAAIREGSGKHS